MPKTFEVPLPIRIDKLTEFLRIRGTPVYAHWTVFLIVALILLNVTRHPLTSILGLVAYFFVLLLHETGHLVAAQRLGCDVLSVKLYPVFGITRFETPWSKFDHCLIAWGGVIAQAAVALPIVGWLSYIGYTRFEPVNAVLTILGYFSLGVAVFNLLPFAPLDGATAWAIIPAFAKRLRRQR